jgi:hypothetical protein
LSSISSTSERARAATAMTERVLGTLPRRRRELDHGRPIAPNSIECEVTGAGRRRTAGIDEEVGPRRHAARRLADCPHGDVKRAIRGRMPVCRVSPGRRPPCTLSSRVTGENRGLTAFVTNATFLLPAGGDVSAPTGSRNPARASRVGQTSCKAKKADSRPQGRPVRAALDVRGGSDRRRRPEPMSARRPRRARGRRRRRMGCALAGIGMGDATAEGEPPPSAAQVAATQRIAAGAAAVHRGQALFADQGCDRCHSIAAIGANGKVGPRLDDAELQALAAFVTAAAGGRDDGGGRGRGRGRSGTD